MNISIDSKIKEQTPGFYVGVIEANVQMKEDKEVTNLISFYEDTICKTIDIKDVVNLDVIIDGRNAYKTYGKDPSRYRLAVESLYRRLSKGNKLYRINTIVDLGNILSLHTKKSVAVLDYHKIQGDVQIRLGTERDEYEGIGRGTLNIANIPLYEDAIGPFGSTTSDTLRTAITNDTTKILLFIISFSGSEALHKDLEYAMEIYMKHADATILDSYIL